MVSHIREWIWRPETIEYQVTWTDDEGERHSPKFRHVERVTAENLVRSLHKSGNKTVVFKRMIFEYADLS